MHYVLLIHQPSAAGAEMPDPDAIAEIIAEVDRFDKELTSRGQNVGSIRLSAAETSQVIRVRGGDVLNSDGPYAETKEQLGGIWMIEADGPEEAARIAADLPVAAFGTVEVRPVQGIDVREPVQAFYDDR